MTDQQLLDAVRRNLEWFCNSGVMDPPDGSWGVAERIAVTKDNTAIEKICRAFPAWNEFDGYCVIEPRRPDCNFETALLFLLAGRKFGSEEFTRTGENLLMYLYNRSGMIFPENSVWNWSNITKQPGRWFDDNGWCGAIQFRIAALRPDLDRKYRMRGRALRLARLLAAGVDRSLGADQEISHGSWPDPEGFWLGEPRLPHWGAVALLAGTAALAVEPDPVLAIQLRRYYEYVGGRLDAFIASELCYALLGLQAAAGVTGDEAVREAYRKLLELLTAVQDRSDNPAFRGCWRGMYDLRAGEWGGGDLFEGGQNSIYTGWTNAPIALGLLLAADRTSLAAL